MLLTTLPASRNVAGEGVQVTELTAAASLDDLAAAALDARKRWPRATLIVAAPEGLLRQLRKRYPPLIDVGLTSLTGEAIARVLEAQAPL